MPHVIRKQVIDLQLDRRLDAFSIQNTISERYKSDFLQKLENLFDSMSIMDRPIAIERMEVDLGVFHISDIEMNAWQDPCLREIAEQLKRLTATLSRSGPDVEPEFYSIYRQWIYYMEHGHLPWSISRIDARWFEKVLEAIAVNFDFASELKVRIKTNPVFLERIIAQHRKRYIWKLVNVLTACKQPGLGHVVSKLHRSFVKSREASGSGNVPRVSKEDIWKLVLYVAATEKTNVTIKEMTERVEFLHSTALTHVKVSVAEIKGIPTTKGGVDRDKVTGDPEELFSHKEERLSEIDPDGIFVENAGVVLLHPFLSAFFSRLNLVHGKRFVSEHAQKKAIHLVHFLATGEQRVGEHRLVIPKLLCSYALDRPIEKHTKLSRVQLAEAESVLRSAIAQWDVLKTTSPEGVREGFLQRRGKLFMENGKVYLQIEASPIDVLLDRLPWNLSLIKLPWMKDMLRVEWR